MRPFPFIYFLQPVGKFFRPFGKNRDKDRCAIPYFAKKKAILKKSLKVKSHFVQHRIHLSKALLIAVKNGKAKTLAAKKMAEIRKIWTATEDSNLTFKSRNVRIYEKNKSSSEIREFIS